MKTPNPAPEPTPKAFASGAPINLESLQRCAFQRRRGYGATSEFMEGLSYTTVIEPAEPLARLSRRSRAKTDQRGSALDRQAAFVLMRFTALLFIAALFAGCATHKDDARLLGTWRCNPDASIAAMFQLYPSWTNAPAERVQRLRDLFSSTVTYSSHGVGTAQYHGETFSFHYQVVRQRADYVIIFPTDAGRNIRIRFVDGDTGYWIDAGPLGFRLSERFDRVSTPPNTALEPLR